MVVSIAAVKNPAKVYNYTVPLNETITDAMSTSQWKETTKKHFKTDKIKKDKTLIQIKIKAEKDLNHPTYAKMTVEGILKVEGENYPFTAEGLVGLLDSPRGDYYHGSLEGELKNINNNKNLNNQNFVLGLDLLPDEDKIVMSTSVGSLEDMGLLYFGEGFVDEQLAKLIEAQQNNSVQTAER